MDSSMIGKILKAKRYAEERDRIIFDGFRVKVRGNHTDHVVRYEDGVWSCDCDFFSQRGVCSHTMAIERVLDGMIEPGHEPAGEVHPS
jgi:hypothetical protein